MDEVKKLQEDIIELLIACPLPFDTIYDAAKEAVENWRDKVGDFYGM